MVDQEFKEFFMCQTFNISLIYDVWVKWPYLELLNKKKVLRFLKRTYNNPAFIYNLFKLYTWLYIIKLSCQEYGIYTYVVFFLVFFITKSVHSEYIIIEHTCIINFFFQFSLYRRKNWKWNMSGWNQKKKKYVLDR